MIISVEKKLIIITPSKTGSTSMHNLLCERGKCMYVIGPRSVDGLNTIFYDRHTFIMPSMYINEEVNPEKYKIVCMARNPRSRLVSLYKHARFLNLVDKSLPIHSFYFQYMIPHLCDDFYKNIFSLSNLCNIEIDEYWKIENIEKHLSDHGFDTDIKKLNHLPDDIDNGLDLEFAKHWINPDCNLLGY